MSEPRNGPLLGLKLALKIGIQHTNAVLQSTPEELLQQIDRTPFTDLDASDIEQKPRDVCFMVDNLQEVLNCLLDARKRLLRLGLYNLDTDYGTGTTREQEIQIRARKEVPTPLEEDENSDSPAAYFSSDP